MIVESFDDPVQVADAVKKLSKTKLSKKERATVARIIDPQEVHENIIDVLDRILKGESLQ